MPFFIQEEELQGYSGSQLKNFTCDIVSKPGTRQLFSMHITQENEDASYKAVNAYHHMQKQKKQEPSIVFSSCALVNPNTMMVKLFYAYIANTTML